MLNKLILLLFAAVLLSGCNSLMIGGSIAKQAFVHANSNKPNTITSESRRIRAASTATAAKRLRDEPLYSGHTAIVEDTNYFVLITGEDNNCTYVATFPVVKQAEPDREKIDQYRVCGEQVATVDWRTDRFPTSEADRLVLMDAYTRAFNESSEYGWYHDGELHLQSFIYAYNKATECAEVQVTAIRGPVLADQILDTICKDELRQHHASQ